MFVVFVIVLGFIRQLGIQSLSGYPPITWSWLGDKPNFVGFGVEVLERL